MKRGCLLSLWVSSFFMGVFFLFLVGVFFLFLGRPVESSHCLGFTQIVMSCIYSAYDICTITGFLLYN